MLKSVLALLRRFAATLAMLALVPSTASLCAGWQPTAEARRACCAAGLCGEEHPAPQTPTGERVMTQADADSCCAQSESEQQGTSSSLQVLATVSAPTLPCVVLSSPPLVRYHLVRWFVPLQSANVPKHVLLSVFLV